MLRALLIAGTVLAIGCPSRAPEPAHPQAADDTALRVRVARLEAKRAAGVDELVELATRGTVHERELALRGLGRIGGDKAIETLKAAIDDPDPAIATAAYAALGVLASLDDSTPLEGFGKRIVDRVSKDKLSVSQMVAIMEAFGRGGTEADQSLVLDWVAGRSVAVPVVESYALALGRMGRRKIALTDAARTWAAMWTTHADRGVRYAATYALAREVVPPIQRIRDPLDRSNDPIAPAEPLSVMHAQEVETALAKRVTDSDPEIRAIAIFGLVRHDAIAAARKDIEDSLRDRDWRVAVEAVRALAGDKGDDAGRELVARQLGTHMTELEKGNLAEAHVIIEALQLLAKHDRTVPEIAARAQKLADPLLRGWIASSTGVDDPALPDHLRLPLGAKPGKRDVLRGLLEHEDSRVRAAALPVLAATWKDGDAADHRATVTTFVAALASPDPIVAGSAVDAAEALYDAMGDAPDKKLLDDQLVQRAARERDVELSASLYELVGKRAIGAGADACRAGLSGHIVRARAAAACLKKLGEAVPAPAIGAAEPPPVDVASVIGKHVVWHVETTRGAIDIELLPGVAPWNVATIVVLARKGFYDGLEFHRVVPDFVVQGGDPTMSGWGGPGFTTPAEPATALDGDGFVAGGIGIADAGRDSGGSQWFAMHSRAPHLDGRYTWIGRVISGQKSADALEIGDRIVRSSVEVR